MTAPDKIWITPAIGGGFDDDCGMWWLDNSPQAVEYTRTATIPDPMDDPRVVALVGAAKIMIEGVDAGYYKNNPAFKDLRAALSAITKEPPHER